MNVQQLMTAIPVVQQLKRTLHVIGPHGTGKSSVVYQTAKQIGYGVVEKRMGQINDPGDLTGLPDHDRDENGLAVATRFVQPEWFMKLFTNDGRWILFLDEINRSHKDTLQAIFELVYDRSLNGMKLPDNVIIVAASNPPGGDYHVLDFNDPAFQDRFVHVAFTPTAEDFLNYCREKKLNKEIVQFLAENTGAIRGKSATKPVDLDFIGPTQRSWEAVAELLSLEIADKAVENEMIIGLVGTAEYYQLLQWRENQEKLPSGEEIVKNFPKHKKLIKKIVKSERNDAVGTMVESVIAHMNDFGSITDSAQVQNVTDFLTELSDENIFGFFQALMNSSKGFVADSSNTLVQEPIWESEPLKKRFRAMATKIDSFRKAANPEEAQNV